MLSVITPVQGNKSHAWASRALFDVVMLCAHLHLLQNQFAFYACAKA